MKKQKIFTNGIFSGNAPLALFLGLCPILATTTSFSSAFGFGIAILVTLILTNTSISAIRRYVPSQIRIPVLIVIITTIVTVIEMFMHAYMFDLSQTLGVYLSLIAVNCIILGRAEAFAMKNTVLDSLLDGIGTGIGFILSLSVIALLREFLGTGGLVFTSLLTGKELWSFVLIPSDYVISIFVTGPGAFLVFGLLVALINVATTKHSEHLKRKKAQELTEVATGGNI